MDEVSEVFSTKNEQGKINFLFRKTKFGTHWEFCAYHRTFGFWKGPSGQTISKGKSVYKIPKWQHELAQYYKQEKLVSYFLNNAANTYLYGLKISENIEN